MIVDFGKKAGTKTTKSFDLTGMKILNSKETVYSYNLSDIINDENELSEKSRLTKASNVEVLDVTVYTIEFEKDGQEGYAIASGDARVDDVFAFVPFGNLADTSYNEGLRYALYNIKGACEFNLKNYYLENDLKTKYIRQHFVVNPLTNLKWNQTSPYNGWATVGGCSNLDWRYENRAPAGCTPVAIAQVVAYLSPPAIRSQLKLNELRKITSFTQGTTNQAYAYEIGDLLRSAGYWVNATYKCDGTLAKIKDIRDEFNSWGISYCYSEGNIDLGSLGYNLAKGYPHITAGFTKKPSRVGHAWVWEGIYCYIEKNNASTKKLEFSPNSTIKLWCNWGWGGYDDGWFISYEQPTDYSHPFLDDNSQLYITGTSYVIPN